MSGVRAGSGGIELGEVIAVNDPAGLNRVQVRFLARGARAGHQVNAAHTEAAAWALVALPFAGSRMGAFLLPGVGTRVVLSFLNNDMRLPVVIGAVFDGSMRSPETLGGSRNSVDRWSFTGAGGTRIAIIEENGSSAIEIKTAAGNGVTVNEKSGRLTVTHGGSTLTMDGGGMKLQSHSVEISAATFKLTASMSTFETPLADFSGIVTSALSQTNAVVSPSYTPGAGNML